MPRPEQVFARIGERTRDEDAFRVQRQQVRVVLEQHDGLARDLARRGAMRGGHAHALLEVFGNVRFFEQTEPTLERQRAQDFAIDLVHAQPARRHRARQLRVVDAVFHVDGHRAFAQRLHGRFEIVGRRAVVAHLRDAGVVGDQHAVEAELAAQHVLEHACGSRTSARHRDRW